MSDQDKEKLNGCKFARLLTADTIFDGPETKQEETSTIANYVVLLTMRDENHELQNLYHAVTYDWKERESQGELAIPGLTIEMYNYEDDPPRRTR